MIDGALLGYDSLPTIPSRGGGFLGNSNALFCRQRGCSRFSAPLSKRSCMSVAIVILPILDLAGCDIDDQLPELDRVARTFETLGCHAANMARCRASENPPSRPDAIVTSANVPTTKATNR